MKYGEIIYVSFGSIIPYLCLQSRRSLGKLTRHVLETALQRPHLAQLPPRLEPLLERAQRGLMVMYEDRLPPTWTLLLPRMREMYPALIAMRSKDLGLLMRRILQMLSGKMPAETDAAPLPPAMEFHLDLLTNWLASGIHHQKQMEELAGKAFQAAGAVCAAHEAVGLTPRELAGLICVQKLARRDISRNPAETACLRVALSLCEEPNVSEPALKKLLAEALGDADSGLRPSKRPAPSRAETQPVSGSESVAFDTYSPVNLGA